MGDFVPKLEADAVSAEERPEREVRVELCYNCARKIALEQKPRAERAA